MENNLLNRPYLLTLLMAGLIAVVAVVLPIINKLVDRPSVLPKIELIETERTDVESFSPDPVASPDPAVLLFP
jgi:hypothetical protein